MKISPVEYAKMCLATYKETKEERGQHTPIGWKEIDSYNKNGLAVICFQKENIAYIAIRGTYIGEDPIAAFLNLRDDVKHAFIDDANVADFFNKEGIFTKFQKSPHGKHIEHYIFGGHSLGAAIAQMLALKHNIPAVTFECPGIGHHDLYQKKKETNKIPEIISFLSAPNPINMARPQIGRIYRYSIPHFTDGMRDLLKEANKKIKIPITEKIIEQTTKVGTSLFHASQNPNAQSVASTVSALSLIGTTSGASCYPQLAAVGINFIHTGFLFFKSKDLITKGSKTSAAVAEYVDFGQAEIQCKVLWVKHQHSIDSFITDYDSESTSSTEESQSKTLIEIESEGWPCNQNYKLENKIKHALRFEGASESTMYIEEALKKLPGYKPKETPHVLSIALEDIQLEIINLEQRSSSWFGYCQVL